MNKQLESDSERQVSYDSAFFNLLEKAISSWNVVSDIAPGLIFTAWGSFSWELLSYGLKELREKIPRGVYLCLLREVSPITAKK